MVVKCGGKCLRVYRQYMGGGLSPLQTVTDIMTNPKKVIHIRVWISPPDILTMWKTLFFPPYMLSFLYGHSYFVGEYSPQIDIRNGLLISGPS